MRFIGDVHGKMRLYKQLLIGCPASIQVGDFGAGFITLPDDVGPTHRFIRGNHDSPAICRQSPNWIPDGTVEGDMMFVGGAYSIDRDDRTLGVDWWDDEELSHFQLDMMINLYEQTKPRIMVTHEGPHTPVHSFFPHMQGSSRTARALDAMFDIHQPEYWFLGHHHRSINQIVQGTRFICLGELEYIDI